MRETASMPPILGPGQVKLRHPEQNRRFQAEGGTFISARTVLTSEINHDHLNSTLSAAAFPSLRNRPYSGFGQGALISEHSGP